MPPKGQLAFLLVGDHLGQVKKVLPENGEVLLLEGCNPPSSSNPVVSIEPIAHRSRQLIATRNGDMFLYDCVQDKMKSCNKVEEDLIKALPLARHSGTKNSNKLLVYSKQMIVDGVGEVASIKAKSSEIKNAKVRSNQATCVGVDIPLRIFDIETKSKLFDAEPPEKNWLGVKPEVVVSGLDYVDDHRVATCSRSDSTVRVYDTRSKPKPIINANMDHTAFNEHAEASRFICVASDCEQGNQIVVGSNVGQILALDLRFNAAKQVPQKKSKKFAPRTHKILGSFKGTRGGSVKDLKIVPAYKDDDEEPRVVSCCLDRYLRIHLFTRTKRYLDKHIYLNTKPTCCSPVLYAEPTD